MIAVNKKINKKEFHQPLMKNLGEIRLGSVTSEEGFLRKLYRDYGTGKFYICDMSGPSVHKLFKGYIKDKDPFLVIQIDEYNYLSQKLGLESLDWGEEGYVKIKKESPEEDSII